MRYTIIIVLLQKYEQIKLYSSFLNSIVHTTITSTPGRDAFRCIFKLSNSNSIFSANSHFLGMSTGHSSWICIATQPIDCRSVSMHTLKQGRYRKLAAKSKDCNSCRSDFVVEIIISSSNTQIYRNERILKSANMV